MNLFNYLLRENFDSTTLDSYKYIYDNTTNTIKITGYDWITRSNEITIPEKINSILVTEIAEDAFITADITKITLPPSITSIGNRAFTMTFIKTIDIPNSVKRIGDGVFSGCKNLISVNFAPSSNIEFIGKNLFIESTITNFTIPPTLRDISDGMFMRTDITNITIPDSITKIGKSVFEGCSKLTNVILSNNITNIDKNTFNGTVNLKNIIIPPNVTSIGEYAFFNTGLINITIPNKVKNIDYGAFYYSQKLNTIYFEGDIPGYTIDFDGKIPDNQQMGGDVFYNIAPKARIFNKTWSGAEIASITRQQNKGIILYKEGDIINEYIYIPDDTYKEDEIKITTPNAPTPTTTFNTSISNKISLILSLYSTKTLNTFINIILIIILLISLFIIFIIFKMYTTK